MLRHAGVENIIGKKTSAIRSLLPTFGYLLEIKMYRERQTSMAAILEEGNISHRNIPI